MKNKVVSAMLIAMSVSLTTPSMAVYATDEAVENPEVYEESTGEEYQETDMAEEDPGTGETSDTTTENPAEENPSGEEDYTGEETPGEEASGEEVPSDEVPPEGDSSEGSTDEGPSEDDDEQEVTIADTVRGFEFSEIVFGETLSAALTDHAQSIAGEFETIYDAERDLIDFAVSYVESVDAESASDTDYIASIKLQIAKMFEEAYGDDAFEAGVKIREEILADNDFEADFSGCQSYADLDTVYVNAEGMIDSPSEFWNYMNYPEDYEDQSGDDNNNPGGDINDPSGDENDPSGDDPGNTPGGDVNDPSGSDPNGPSGGDSGDSNNPGGDTSDDPVDPPVDDPTNPPINDDINDPDDPSINDDINDPTNPPIEDDINDPVDPPIDDDTNDPVDPPTNDPTNPPVNDPNDPSTDDPSIDDPSVNDPSVNNPSVDDPSTDDPSVNDPTNPPVNDNPEENQKPLHSYCGELPDIVVPVGGEIQMPDIDFDRAYVASIYLDTSGVDVSTPGVYTGTYVITGVNAETEKVDVRVTVTEDVHLEELRNKMASRIDKIEDGLEITIEPYAGQWAKAAFDAKEQIYAATSQEEMEQIIKYATEQARTILSAQQLAVAKNGFIDILKELHASLTFDTDSQQEEADRILQDAIDRITAAESVDAASAILEESRTALQNLKSDVPINDLINQADLKLKELMGSINDNTTLLEDAYKVISNRLHECTDAKEVDSIVNTASFIFEDIRKIVEDGSVDAFTSMFTNFKGIAHDTDEMAVIDLAIAEGTPSDVNVGCSIAGDIFKALSVDLSEFCSYLSEECGEEVAGETKAAAYSAYLDILEHQIANGDLIAIRKEYEEKMDALAEGKDQNYLTDAVMSVIQNGKDSLLTADSEKACQDIYAATEKQFAEAYSAAMAGWYADQMDALLAKYNFTGDFLTKAQEIVDQQKANICKTGSEDVMKQCLSLVESSLEELAGEQAEADVIDKARTEAIATITSLVADPPARIQKIIDKYVKKLESAKTQEEIDSLVEKCKNALEKEQAEILSEAAAKELAKAKTKAIEELKAYVSKEPSKMEVDVLISYINDINKATDVDTVNSLLANGKTALDAARQNSQTQQPATPTVTPSDLQVVDPSGNQSGSQSGTQSGDQSGTQSGDQSSATDLATAKNDAIKTLAMMLDSIYNNPSSTQEIKSAATQAYNKYVNAINSAMTVSDVQSLLASAKAELIKYGAVDNSPSKNTGTSGGSSEKGASLKGDANAGQVKTGDPNTGVIVGSVSAIAGSALAAFLTLWKRKRSKR